MDIAVQKVRNLFQAGIKVEDGKSSKIKDSTDQEQIDEALKAIGEIDTKDGRRSEESGAVFSLQSAIIVAQAQLNEREGKGKSSKIGRASCRERLEIDGALGAVEAETADREGWRNVP